MTLGDSLDRAHLTKRNHCEHIQTGADRTRPDIPEVATGNGLIRGQSSDGIYSFKGIPTPHP